MNNNIHIKDELKEIAPQLLVQQTMPYQVSAAYFNHFSNEIIEVIAAQSLEDLNKKTMPYALPNNYFSNFSSELIQSIQLQKQKEAVKIELQEIAPLLNTISKQQIFNVPNGYLENVNFTKTITQQHNTPVISIVKSRKWLYAAVAAVVFAISIAGVYIVFNTSNKTKMYDFAVAKNIDVNNTMQQLTDEELTKYLYSEHLVSNSEFINNEFDELPDVQQEIKKITDEELKQYLKEEVISTSKKNG